MSLRDRQELLALVRSLAKAIEMSSAGERAETRKLTASVLEEVARLEALPAGGE